MYKGDVFYGYCFEFQASSSKVFEIDIRVIGFDPVIYGKNSPEQGQFAAIKAVTINKTTDILDFAAMMKVTPAEQKMMRTFS
jgi:hypothetical protein